ncbi:MAG: hypothetical protein PHY09_04835 [Desulfuromonadaceae bacterium]|nr:hypothetical protein [Desulfuromonadaceae bacterium]MDD5104685.1 hypothetical protein [Desulfuromonadaceae bacterium]
MCLTVILDVMDGMVKYVSRYEGTYIVRNDGTVLEISRMPVGTAHIIDWFVALAGKYPNPAMVTEVA